MKKTILTKTYLQTSYQQLVERGRLDLDFIILIMVASAICALGFNINSPSVIIGSMVISPLLYTIVLLGSSLFKRDYPIFFYSIKTTIIGGLLSILTAAIITYLFPFTYHSEIIDRIQAAPIIYFYIALFTGIGGTFAYYWPNISEAITGISISVALIPPIVMMGIAIINLDWPLLYSSSIIAGLNILGIIIATFFVAAFLHWRIKK